MKYAMNCMACILLCFFLSSCKKTENIPDKNLQGDKSKVDSKYVFATDNLKRYAFPTHINDLVIDRKYSSVSEVFMVVIEPNKAPLLHKHDDTEQIFYIIQGAGVLSIGQDQAKYPVKVGDVVRIPVSTWHSIKANENDTVKYLCVDCFASKNAQEPTWDDHVKAVCASNGWDYNKVVAK